MCMQDDKLAGVEADKEARLAQRRRELKELQETILRESQSERCSLSNPLILVLL